MSIQSITIKGELLGIDSQFDFVKTIKNDEKSHYKLSLLGNFKKVTKAWREIFDDIDGVSEEEMIDNEGQVEVQVIHKPSSKSKNTNQSKKDIEKVRKEIEEKTQKLNELLDKQEELTNEGKEGNTDYNSYKEETNKILSEIDELNTILSNLNGLTGKEYTPKSFLAQSKKLHEAKTIDINDNSIWIFAIKVFFEKSVGAKGFTFSSFSMVISHFGTDVTDDDKKIFLDKIKFANSKDSKDVMILQMQAIIEQNQFLQKCLASFLEDNKKLS